MVSPVGEPEFFTILGTMTGPGIFRTRGNIEMKLSYLSMVAMLPSLIAMAQAIEFPALSLVQLRVDGERYLPVGQYLFPGVLTTHPDGGYYLCLDRGSAEKMIVQNCLQLGALEDRSARGFIDDPEVSVGQYVLVGGTFETSLRRRLNDIGLITGVSIFRTYPLIKELE